MIIVYTEGGLGNVLFQLSFAVAKSIQHNTDYYFLNFEENSAIIKDRHHADIEGYKTTIFRNIKTQLPPKINQPTILHRCEFKYEDYPYEPQCYNFYKGYFQSEKFFINYLKDIKKLFEPTEEIINYIKAKYPYVFTLNCVSLHLRRGDYLSLPYHHPIIPIEYYHRALKQFSNVDKILVFTNDLDWCYSNLIDSRMVFVEESDWMSLYIMSFCKNHITANSSFSWWGARFAEMFNDNIDVKVIAPSVWFGPAVHGDFSDLIPDRWIRFS